MIVVGGCINHLSTWLVGRIFPESPAYGSSWKLTKREISTRFLKGVGEAVAIMPWRFSQLDAEMPMDSAMFLLHPPPWVQLFFPTAGPADRQLPQARLSVGSP